VTAATGDLLGREAQLEEALAAPIAPRDQHKALYEQLRDADDELKQGLLGQKAERVTPDDRQLTPALIETILAEHGAPEEAKTPRAIHGHERAKPSGRKPLAAASGKR
jgi:hypothetical protein